MIEKLIGYSISLPLGRVREGLWGRAQKKPLKTLLSSRALVERGRPPTLPHCIAVPSAQVGLTSLFGMGRGGTPPQ